MLVFKNAKSQTRKKRWTNDRNTTQKVGIPTNSDSQQTANQTSKKLLSNKLQLEHLLIFLQQRQFFDQAKLFDQVPFVILCVDYKN